jgi:hypothetical protein
MVGDRLLLVDPRGEIHEDDLLEFMERHVEPAFWAWLKQKEAAERATGKGTIRAMQVETPAAEGVEPVEMKGVASGAPVYLVNCWRCGGQISWRLDLGHVGGCPYCGAWLQLVL